MEPAGSWLRAALLRRSACEALELGLLGAPQCGRVKVRDVTARVVRDTQQDILIGAKVWLPRQSIRNGLELQLPETQRELRVRRLGRHPGVLPQGPWPECLRIGKARGGLQVKIAWMRCTLQDKRIQSCPLL